MALLPTLVFKVASFDLQIASENNDVQLVDFVETEFLSEQLNPCFMFSLVFSLLFLLNNVSLNFEDGVYDLVFCFFYIQVEAIKKISEYVAQLRRVGKGHGNHIYIYIFVQIILKLINTDHLISNTWMLMSKCSIFV